MEATKNNTELVSVIVPIYKVEAYIRNCVESILNQTYKNLEIILVDDGSPDKCGEICDEYAAKDSRVKVIHKKNAGVSEARNSGLDVARGDYIAFVDGDDRVEEQFIEYLHILLREHNADVSICSFKFLKDESKIINHPTDDGKVIVMDNEQLLFQALKAKLFSNSPCLNLFKGNVFVNLRFPAGKIYEDIPTILKAYAKCDKAVFGNRCLYTYIYREGSITKRDFEPAMLTSISFAEESFKWIIKKYPSLNKIAECRMFDQYFEMLRVIKNKDEKIYREIYDGLKSVRRTAVFCRDSGFYRRCKAILSYFKIIV